ncbi:hypothetical protein NDU88_009291 [Pleurodeles waltl]|uniref:Uncharacterized protein n=1 Tax=Pleurodeles waltl TaxID=8319 RepID=A0AAV7PRN9_PLEWA|nr:hypothetical protein NDU88_009291 [Pleurodeles waltl]
MQTLFILELSGGGRRTDFEGCRLEESEREHNAGLCIIGINLSTKLLVFLNSIHNILGDELSKTQPGLAGRFAAGFAAGASYLFSPLGEWIAGSRMVAAVMDAVPGSLCVCCFLRGGGSLVVAAILDAVPGGLRVCCFLHGSDAWQQHGNCYPRRGAGP